ncbi:MAG TPA: ATP-dependent DNA helicase RecG [Dehalococcoidia bacterium]|nr:ATP-dependent DNA helicase RecG [Dehalococcoidia bacterium]
MRKAVLHLRGVLELERKKRFTNTAIVGGLDAYLRRFLQDNPFPPEHRFRQVLSSLPGRGYVSLHPIQRKRVVEELLKALPLVDPGPQSKRTAPVQKPPKQPVPAVSLSTPLSFFKGLRRTDLARLNRLGLITARDILFHFPYRYNDFASIRPIASLVVGEEQTVIASVWSASATTVGRRKATEAIVGDDSGTLRVIWWGQTYIARQLRSGVKIALSGKVTAFRGRYQIENPEWEPVEAESLNTRRLVPVYPSTEGLPQRVLRRLARQVVDTLADRVEESLPPALLSQHRLLPVAMALRQVHFPDSQERVAAARRRLAFEELLAIELGVVKRRLLWQAGASAPVLTLPLQVLDGFIASLPFHLTRAQERAIAAVSEDIARELPMNRLLEGDVGSGKTVIAAAALLATVASGYQGAIMAPTELLAEQHYRTLSRLLDPERAEGNAEGPWFSVFGAGFSVLQPSCLDRPLRVTLLIGSLKQEEKAAAQEAIARGESDIIIGTHAIIQEDVSFQRLGLAVIDEQHRFGVLQRAALREKGQSPHLLVMTATPIPRTLALTVYGDLDVTVMDEMPPGRPPVKTYRLLPAQRRQAYDFLRKRIVEGRQAYIICPLVEESEVVAAKAAVQEYERLSRDVFPDLRLGLLHGRQPPSEKDAVMRDFRDSQLDILVSTAVVEVGVDVPNATVILIEGAERFGLAQLHQFRGRVRRSERQSYCLLLSENPSEEVQERLRIMETVNDGFQLAEEDLRLRGPGEYFGVRQSGLPDLRVASLTDIALIEETREAATRLLQQDPDLSRPEHRTLRERLSRLWENLSAEAS